jgi:hypothetical protein
MNYCLEIVYYFNNTTKIPKISKYKNSNSRKVLENIITNFKELKYSFIKNEPIKSNKIQLY